MLKEMTMLAIVLWGIQGMPTTPSQADLNLSKLYCEAESLLEKYESIGNKYLSPEMRSKMEIEFSQSVYNFTKSAEECQILREFKELFIWLKNTYQQDKYLKSVMRSFTFLAELQERYTNQTCSEGASDEVPAFSGPNYSTESKWPSTQNMLHYIFELYKGRIQKLLSSKLKLEQKTIREMCKAKNH